MRQTTSPGPAAIRDMAARLTVRQVAEIAQSAAEVSMVWTTVKEDAELTLHVADTPAGRYEISEFDDGCVVSTYLRTPLTPEGTTAELDEDGEIFAASELRRLKKRCEGQLAWLMSHDTSYEEVPATLDF